MKRIIMILLLGYNFASGQITAGKLILQVINYSDTINKFRDAEIVLRLENNTSDTIIIGDRPFIYFHRVYLNNKSSDTIKTENEKYSSLQYNPHYQAGLLLPGKFKDFKTNMFFAYPAEKGNYLIKYYVELEKYNLKYEDIATRWLKIVVNWQTE